MKKLFVELTKTDKYEIKNLLVSIYELNIKEVECSDFVAECIIESIETKEKARAKISYSKRFENDFRVNVDIFHNIDNSDDSKVTVTSYKFISKPKKKTYFFNEIDYPFKDAPNHIITTIFHQIICLLDLLIELDENKILKITNDGSKFYKEN